MRQSNGRESTLPVYHRHGNFREDGTVAWHYRSTSGSQSFGVPLLVMKQKFVEGNTTPKMQINGMAEYSPVSVAGDMNEVSGHENGAGHRVPSTDG